MLYKMLHVIKEDYQLTPGDWLEWVVSSLGLVIQSCLVIDCMPLSIPHLIIEQKVMLAI